MKTKTPNFQIQNPFNRIPAPLFVLLLNLLSFEAYSQFSSTWKGMTPGHERQWSYPSNWSRNAVPDEFTDVIIPYDITGGQNYPELRVSETVINSLYVSHGAHITVHRGRIVTLDEAKNFYKSFQIVDPGRVNKSRPAMGEELVLVKKNAFLQN